jgi:RNA polymerase sigma-70 factor (ECF subfamily)
VTKTLAPAQYASVSESSGLEGFDDLYDREFAYLWRLLGRLGVPPADLADAVHDTFVIVCRRWKELDPARPVRPWLFGVARKVAAAARRRRREHSSDGVAEPAAPAPPHAERDLLWRALAELNDDRREVVVLHDLEGYTGVEIGGMLEIPANTVHSRLRLAREDLAAAVRRLRAGEGR